ncbi:DRTGG domain-containing protein [Serpentinicella sp. ANB-PHB4]|uniref:DRTGG domain-containing protein n=1 Tax=Serpentinicella sp. ANB-PHB4 TaxID=3074076 RepID=UPI0028632F71|nr:DRTGG domain-containing protein [Serpentinicella sp. ANB-PHB4]MDR5657874.1 DRTGG domain-containing protein [Serpentinicella sp. ANB-PHB4]
MIDVKQLIKELDLEIVSGEDGLSNIIKGVYIGDLLSWVMAKLKEGDIWITIQTHVNVVAVASLGEAACIIVPENAQIDENTTEKSNEQNIPILRSDLTAYELSLKLGPLVD